jgi:translation elongation factor EF-1alpha
LVLWYLVYTFLFALFYFVVVYLDVVDPIFVLVADAGKSTIGGQILFLSGQVDDRTIQKYEKEAKDKSRESW